MVMLISTFTYLPNINNLCYITQLFRKPKYYVGTNLLCVKKIIKTRCMVNRKINLVHRMNVYHRISLNCLYKKNNYIILLNYHLQILKFND